VAEANAAGGYRGLPYRVVFRPDDLSWSVVAAQVVRLAHEDQVWGVIASLDGERAHAAELVAAKLWTPVITPGAADLTIDYANVPWVFRLMPADRAQADCLLAATVERGLRRVVLAVAGTRDGRLATERVRESARDAGVSLALEVEFDKNDPRPAVPRLVAAAPEALLLWGEPPAAVLLLRQLRLAAVRCPAFVPSVLVGSTLAACSQKMGTVFGAAPFDLSSERVEVQRFREGLRAAGGGEATHIAAYGYDAARLLIDAIAAVGLNRARICDWLLIVRTRGVTGDIAFTGLGGSPQRPVLVSLEDGRWVSP
jgi:ABC-type branched-subunit amino acid transport system substrate-binding protein